jgi:2-aminobenzoylacetyl-CoA thioesterase
MDEMNGAVVRKLDDRLWLLGVHHFNLYLLIGADRSALIEVGVSAVADRVLDQLNQLQIEPDYLILTHPHTDHLTGLGPLQEAFPGAKVVLGDGAIEFLQHPKAEKAMVLEDRYLSERLSALGYPPGFPPVRQVPLIADPIVVAHHLTLDLGKLQLHIDRVGGHSPGQLLIYVPEMNAVFPSDALGFHFPGRFVLPLFFTGWSDFFETVQRIIALSPTIIGMAHQGPILATDAAAFLQNVRETTLALRDRIANDPRTDDRVAAELFEDFYRDEFTLYSRENIQNCMALLVKRGRAQ